MSEFAQWQASERDRVEAERRAWVGYEAPRDDEIDSLDGEVAFLEDFALAPNSKRTMTYPQKRFQRWLIKERITPGKGGFTDDQLRRYVADLSRDDAINRFSVVKTYMSYGPRYYCQKNMLQWRPIKERPRVQEVLTALRRRLKDKQSNQKQAVTVEMLRKMRAHVDLGNHKDLCIYTAVLVGFFCLLRKANLGHRTAHEAQTAARQKATATTSRRPKEDVGVLTRDAVSRDKEGRICLTLKGTKTIQFGQRQLRLYVPKMPPGDPICPATILQLYMAVTGDRPAGEALFGYWTEGGPGKPQQWKHLTHRVLVKGIKDLIKAIGEDPTKFAGHSLRRGGATFAFISEAGLHQITIKALGDWVSDAFLAYCEVQDTLRVAGAQAMALAAQQSRTTGTASRRPLL